MIRSGIIGDETVKKFIRRHRKAVALSVLALGVFLVIVVRPDFRGEPDVTPPTMEPPATVPTDTVITATGIVRTGHIVHSTRLPINSGFDGRISEVYVKEGEMIKAGQPLFKLEASALQKTTGTAASLPSNETAQRDYNRLQKLYEQGMISRRELENAEKRLGAAPSNSNPGPSIPAGPVITAAPIAGVVTDLAVAADLAVQSGQRLLSLGSGETLAAVVLLEQQELYRVQPGTPVSIEVSGVTVKGEVAGIFPEVKENAIVAFLAHINLVKPPAGLLQPGLTVTVRIETGP